MNSLQLGNCIELIKVLPERSIDLTITSPPYDNLRTYDGCLNAWNFDVFKVLAKELFRVTACGGTVVWIVNDETINGSESGSSFKQALYFKEVGFNLHDTMIWSKPAFTATGALKVRYAQTFEYMFVFTKGRIKTFNPIKDRKNVCAGGTIHSTLRQRDGSRRMKTFIKDGKQKTVGEYGQRFNVWEMPACVGRERTGHPAQFPLRLVTDHIISWSNEGDVVLDPFMGSGTTGVACVNTNRNFIGYEVNGDYYSMAKDRINKAIEEIDKNDKNDR